MRKLSLIFLLQLVTIAAIAQDRDTLSDSTIDKRKLTAVIVGGASLYVGGMAGLYGLWYVDYESQPFQSFDDSDEWLQMDKAGHAFAAYHIALAGSELLQWTGMPRKRTIMYSTAYSFLFLSTIEVFDGFSSGWGFSFSDMAANTAGVALMLGQECLWQEQRINIKFSYSPSKYAKYRPELLGDGDASKLFKDYNAQTYWLSGNVRSLGGFEDDHWFPGWFNIALGYGGDGMLGGSENPAFNDAEESLPEFQRRRQFYLSPDIDLRKIKVRSGFLRTTFRVLSFIKVPAPAIEIREGGKVRFLPLFF